MSKHQANFLDCYFRPCVLLWAVNEIFPPQIYVSHPYLIQQLKLKYLYLTHIQQLKFRKSSSKGHLREPLRPIFMTLFGPHMHQLDINTGLSFAKPVWPNVYQFFPTFKNTQFSSLSKLVSSTHPLSNEAENLSGSKLALRKFGVISFTTRQFSSQNRLRVSYSLNLAKPNLVTPTVHLKTKTKCLNGQTSNFQNTPF